MNVVFSAWSAHDGRVWDRFFRKLVVFVIIAGAIYFATDLCAATLVPITKFKKGVNNSIAFHKEKIEFYGVFFKETADDIKATYNNKEVFDVGTQHIFNKGLYIDGSVVVDDCPKQGMQTLFVPIFTGGANCCNVDVMVTKTDDTLFFTSIGTGSGAGISYADVEKNKPIGVSDNCLKQIDLTDVTDDPVMWSTATAPRPLSYVVYDAGGWRFAHPGEMAREYEKLLAIAMRSVRQPPVNGPDAADQRSDLYADAVIVGYYAVMVGKSDSEIDTVLAKILPFLAQGKRKLFLRKLRESIAACDELETMKLSSATAVAAAPRAGTQEPSQSTKGTGADGRFRTTACGSQVDTKTGLEWFVGPDVTMNFGEAGAWAASLTACGGGWSMPAISQLAALFEKGKTAGQGFYIGGKYWPAHIDPAFAGIGGGSWVWSKDTINAGLAKAYNFNQGTETRAEKDGKKLAVRAFAVRSARQ